VTEPQPPRAPLDLRRPRDVGALIGDGFGLYFREFRTFFLIALAVVLPVELIVGGLGLGQFTAEYDSSPEAGEVLIPRLTEFFVISPLATAMSIYALLDVADGQRPRAGSAIQRGLDVFAPLLLVIVLYALGVLLGLLALVIPGIYVLIRWSLCIQAAVIEGERGPDALRRSWALVQGSWWRVFAITIVANFLVGALSALVSAPLLAIADSSGEAVYQLIGQIIGGVLFVPPAALITTLLFFDLKARKGDA
jgi:hypothetical protein